MFSELTIIITLTDSIRVHPYFAGFNEESVTIPDKPFIREILGIVPEGELSSGWIELLPIKDLEKCIETCIYFGLQSSQFVDELFWKIGKTRKTFDAWFDLYEEEDAASSDSHSEEDIQPSLPSRYWSVGSNITEPIRSELITSWGSILDSTKLIELGCRYPKPACEEIVASGNLRLLKWWAHEKSKAKSTSKKSDEKEAKSTTLWHDEVIPAIAARKGHLEILKYLHEEKCPWNETICVAAAKGGHLECLQYAHAGLFNKETSRWEGGGCRLNKETCTFAVAGGTAAHFDCLKYVHACLFNKETSTWEGGECPWDEETSSDAARKGNLDCLKYLHENGCPWDEWTCTYAAGGGHLECLQYAHAGLFNKETSKLEGGGCPWNEDTCSNAALKGKLTCLQYAHENGCPWNRDTCSSAAFGGHLECLKYAHENGCPWNANTCSSAVIGGHLECLKYAHAGLFNKETSRWEGGGCPWNEEECSVVFPTITAGRLECAKYVRDNTPSSKGEPPKKKRRK